MGSPQRHKRCFNYDSADAIENCTLSLVKMQHAMKSFLECVPFPVRFRYNERSNAKKPRPQKKTALPGNDDTPTQEERMEFNFNNLPEEMKEKGLYCCWKYIQKEGKKKPDKVPYDPRTTMPRDPTQPEKYFASFEIASRAFAALQNGITAWGLALRTGSVPLILTIVYKTMVR